MKTTFMRVVFLCLNYFLPHHRKYVGILSRKSSFLCFRCYGEEPNIKSEVKCFWSPMYFSLSALVFEIPSEPLSMRLPLLRKGFWEVVQEVFHPLSVLAILFCRSLVLVNSRRCGSRNHYDSDSLFYLLD